MDSILIVDDERDNLQALQRLLRSEYAIDIETSPFEALKTLQRKEYAVIVSDQRMPEMTGVELLEKAKQINPGTTRILLTGYTDMDAVVGAINRGQIYRYVAKPWDPDDLKLTLRQAAESFNLKKELEQKNRALQKSNEELKNALESLRILDRAKDRFLSLVSHELNTPLTVLTSFTTLLKESKKELPGDMQKAVDSLHAATDRFSEIIGEVLLFTRLETERTLNVQRMDLEKETRDLAKRMAGRFKKKDLSVGLRTSGEANVLGDSEKIRVGLEKLFTSAIEHAPKGDQIKVVIEGSPAEVSYSVERGGPPLSQEAFDSLTAPGRNAMHHHRDLGLSLAICRLIVESHGGTLSLSPDGKCITIHFPK